MKLRILFLLCTQIKHRELIVCWLSSYQKYWTTIGDEVCAACLDFVNGSADISVINTTMISLIPKVKSQKQVTKNRPISLYIVIYKIISKTIANRMKKMMMGFIDEALSLLFRATYY